MGIAFDAFRMLVRERGGRTPPKTRLDTFFDLCAGARSPKPPKARGGVKKIRLRSLNLWAGRSYH